MKWICLLLCCCIVFSGCQSATATTQTAPTVPGDISEFSFSLPEGYTFAADAINSLSILKNDEMVGGLVLTGLDVSCLKDTRSTEVHQYINSYGQMPLICEYIIMQGDDFLAVSMAVTDPDTNIRSETSHRLFAHHSECFDLWFDDGLSDEDREAITNAVFGI